MFEVLMLEGKPLAFHDLCLVSVLVKPESSPFQSLKLLHVDGFFVEESGSFCPGLSLLLTVLCR